MTTASTTCSVADDRGSAPMLDVVDPATGEVVASVPDLRPADALRAADVAAVVAPSWVPRLPVPAPTC